MTPEQQRHRNQLAFVASDTELEIGERAACPLPLEQLVATTGTEPYVREYFSGGLTAHVYRIHAGGRDWTLKRARERCKVQNVDGQTSFLNEIQRRAELRALKRDPRFATGLRTIVDTHYASFRHGVLLSPWIDGKPVRAWDERQLVELFEALLALLLGGLFEWDLCPGNTLDDGQIRLFDFGYMYPFDPLRQFNSNGTATPEFHAAERFETRQFFAHLLPLERQSDRLALAAFDTEKRIALETYRRLRSELDARGASTTVVDWLSDIITGWQQGLNGDLDALYLREAWRSHWLDLQDDLDGQTCTAATFSRIDWLEQAVRERYHDLQLLVSVETAETLQTKLRDARRMARQWQVTA